MDSLPRGKNAIDTAGYGFALGRIDIESAVGLRQDRAYRAGVGIDRFGRPSLGREDRTLYNAKSVNEAITIEFKNRDRFRS